MVPRRVILFTAVTEAATGRLTAAATELIKKSAGFMTDLSKSGPGNLTGIMPMVM